MLVFYLPVIIFEAMFEMDASQRNECKLDEPFIAF